MRRPARVPDADASGKAAAVAQPLGQTLQLAFGLRAGEGAAAVDDGDAGAVIPAILQALQRVQNDWNAVRSPMYPTMPHMVYSCPPMSRLYGYLIPSRVR